MTDTPAFIPNLTALAREQGWMPEPEPVAPVDHTALMLEALEDARHAPNFDGAHQYAAIAQVHATALVAEQAKTANQIAFMVQYSSDRGNNNTFVKFHEDIFTAITRAVGI